MIVLREVLILTSSHVIAILYAELFQQYVVVFLQHSPHMPEFGYLGQWWTRKLFQTVEKDSIADYASEQSEEICQVEQ